MILVTRVYVRDLPQSRLLVGRRWIHSACLGSNVRNWPRSGFRDFRSEINRSGIRRRASIVAPAWMVLARQECTYGAIGMIVGRFVPHITVRKAPRSVAFTDRTSVRMRKRVWSHGTKLRGGIERRGSKCGQHRRAHDAGSAAHFSVYYLRVDPKGGAPEGQHRIAPNSHPAVLWPMGLG